MDKSLEKSKEKVCRFEENVKANAKIKPQRQNCSIDFVDMKRKFETMLEDIHSEIKDK